MNLGTNTTTVAAAAAALTSNLNTLLSLPPEIRVKIWSLCAPSEVTISACHCTSDIPSRRKCLQSHNCLTVEYNDVTFPIPPLLLVSRLVNAESQAYMQTPIKLAFCRYVCVMMFLYGCTFRQLQFVKCLRLVHDLGDGMDCDPEFETYSFDGDDRHAAESWREEQERANGLWTAAGRYFHARGKVSRARFMVRDGWREMTGERKNSVFDARVQEVRDLVAEVRVGEPKGRD